MLSLFEIFELVPNQFRFDWPLRPWMASLRTLSAEEAKVHGWGTKVPSGIHGMIVSLVAAGFILVYFKEIIIPFVLAIFFVYLLRYG